MLITAAMMLAVQTANLTAEGRFNHFEEPCLGSYSCGPDSSYLGYFYHIPSALACRRECDKIGLCQHFTYFSSGDLTGACFIFSSCQQRSTLCGRECVSGPRCSDCETCKPRKPHKRILTILRSTWVNSRHLKIKPCIALIMISGRRNALESVKHRTWNPQNSKLENPGDSALTPELAILVNDEHENPGKTESTKKGCDQSLLN